SSSSGSRGTTATQRSRHPARSSRTSSCTGGTLRSTSSPVSDVGDVDDGSAGVVAGGEVDERVDAPVVVLGGVVEDLADRPAAGVVDRVLVDQEQVGIAGVGADAEGPVLLEVRRRRVEPPLGGPPV